MKRRSQKAKAKRAVRELPEEDPEFQIAPMIDILLVLLVFFMAISSTEVLQSNDKVRLPVAKDAKPKPEGGAPEGMVTINILIVPFTNDSIIEINGQEFQSPTDIIPVLQDELNKARDAKIMVRADKEVRYEYLRGVLKAAGMVGFGNVTF